MCEWRELLVAGGACGEVRATRNNNNNNNKRQGQYNDNRQQNKNHDKNKCAAVRRVHVGYIDIERRGPSFCSLVAPKQQQGRNHEGHCMSPKLHRNTLPLSLSLSILSFTTHSPANL